MRPIALHAKCSPLPIPLPFFKSGSVDASADSCGKPSAFTSPASSSRLSKGNSGIASDTVASFRDSYPSKDVATCSTGTAVNYGLESLKPRNCHLSNAAVMSAVAPDTHQVCILLPLQHVHNVYAPMFVCECECACTRAPEGNLRIPHTDIHTDIHGFVSGFRFHICLQMFAVNALVTPTLVF